MKIRHINIKNFRGVKSFTWGLPTDSLFCLVGKGDSTKSTILEAIRLCLYPYWNIQFFDTDFYNNDTTQILTIEITLGDLLKEFLIDSKYGLMLRGWNSNDQQLLDEPDDSCENVLTVRLSVGNDLEPNWKVINDRSQEGIEFKTKDRAKACVGIIGVFTDRQLSWSNGSALARITDIEDIDESLVCAAREAKTTFDINRELLQNFDKAAKNAEASARQLGVPVSTGFKAQLDISSINLKVSGVALHDNNIPLRLLGLGSRRLLLCGIQQQNLENGHITLIDEIEYGLEPNRISRLIKSIKEDASGQYLITTHSPTVLRELTIDNLYIIHNDEGKVSIQTANDIRIKHLEIQGKIRSNAEAFLGKKIIVCEGATEVGFLRSMDDFLVSKGKDPFAYYGVSFVDANGGSKVKNTAEAFKKLGYDVAVFADSDAKDQLSEEMCSELIAQSIAVFVWTEDLSIEQRIMKDLPWSLILSCLSFIETELGEAAILQQIQQASGNTLQNGYEEWNDSIENRNYIGLAAKKSTWIKNITDASLFFSHISTFFDNDSNSSTELYQKMYGISKWIQENE